MENMKELIKAIKVKMSELPSLTEENIKTHVVVDLFLNSLGYDPQKWDYECCATSGRADLIYKENGKAILAVETKGLSQSVRNPNIDITEQDINQLLGYLNDHDVIWGMLSNGRRYILLNNTIINQNMDKIVLDISIDRPSDSGYLKYFSYEKIFKDKTTFYFADIAQFKAFRRMENANSESWAVYKSALFGFFDYYSANHPYQSVGRNDRKCLENVGVYDVRSYIETKKKATSANGRSVCSKRTIKNAYSYISSFFYKMKEMGMISRHGFEDGRDESLAIYEETPKIKAENHMSIERFEKAMEYLYKDKSNGRNLTVFLLCAYYGFERSEVSNIKWDNIDLNKGIISFNNREYRMIPLIKTLLTELDQSRRKNKSKLEYIIATTDKSNKLVRPTVGTVNGIFNSLVNIDKSDAAWTYFCPQYVRECLIQSMFKNGYSIEQIAAYVGVDAARIISTISTESIVKEGRKRLKKGNAAVAMHPFEKATERFYSKIVA